MNILQYIFRRIAQRQPVRQVAYPNFAKITSILLLYESDWQERNANIRAMAKQLRESGKQVTLIGYVKKDHPTSPVLPESRVLGTKDFTIFGTLKAPVLQDLQKNSYHLLIDLTPAPILPLQYVSLYTKADFKIAAHNPDRNDMVILSEPNASVDYLFSEIMHYLKLIKSAD